MGTTTARLALPMIAPGQAQKEIVHNEALALLDIAVQATVEAAGPIVPPAGPGEGQAWIVGAAPVGDWAGRAGQVAAWTGGGWRFVTPTEGFAVWDRGTATLLRHTGGSWRAATRVTTPSSGTTIDAEARAAIAQLIDALRIQGLLAA